MSLIDRVLTAFLRAIPITWLAFGKPVRLYHLLYIFCSAVPTTMMIGYFNRRRMMRQLYRIEGQKNEAVEDTVRSFSSSKQFQSIQTGNSFNLNDVKQQFLLLLSSHRMASEMADKLNDKLSNYNYRIISIINAQEGDTIQLPENPQLVEYCQLIKGQSEGNTDLSQDTIYLVHVPQQKVLYSGPIDPNDKLLPRTLRLRMNKILDKKFTEGFRGNRMAE